MKESSERASQKTCKLYFPVLGSQYPTPVIANQCAHWCGNLRSWLKYGLKDKEMQLKQMYLR